MYDVAMTSGVIRGIAVISSMLFAVLVVSLVAVAFDVDDQALLMVFVAMISSATSLAVYMRLSGKYLESKRSE